MTNRIIIPKGKIEINKDSLIFLAGPVNCAGGWQNEAIEIIRKKNSQIYIAVPDYGKILHEDYIINSERAVHKFNHQLDWEHHYLEIAEKQGAILFWLAKQKIDMPISPETGFRKVYARDTRGELGAWGWGLLRHKPSSPIAIGAQEGYSGLDVTKRNFTKYAAHIPFRNNLEETCNDALRFINKK